MIFSFVEKRFMRMPLLPFYTLGKVGSTVVENPTGMSICHWFIPEFHRNKKYCVKKTVLDL